MSGYLGSLSVQQTEALEELKEQLSKTDFSERVGSHPDGDKYLLRMLRATMNSKSKKRVFVVSKARSRLEDVLRWKEEHNIKFGSPPEMYDIYRKANPIHVWKDYKSKSVVLYNRKSTTRSIEQH